MEGPSLYLAAQQLKPFAKKKILKVSGNSKIGIDRLGGQTVKSIFSWGKHLVFQFDSFALRVHFMLFGSFEAEVEGASVTGDYKKKNRVPRLKFEFPNGNIEMYSCSLKYLEEKNAKKTYDFSVDVLSDAWDEKQAMQTVLDHPKEQIGDVLLDQAIFAGVGNIIRNEILFMEGIHPEQCVQDIPKPKLKKLIQLARSFSFQFYEWRKQFVLRKNLVLYGRGVCPTCGTKVTRKHTGKRNRRSFYCERCQPATTPIRSRTNSATASVI
jgi:endonuclease VIII